MVRRKLNEMHIRSLNKTSGGKSYSITIPLEYIRKLKWRGRQKVTVQMVGKRIIIEDWE